MAKENKNLPYTAAGLVRYYDQESMGKKIKPEYVIAFSIGIVVVELALKFVLPVV